VELEYYSVNKQCNEMGRCGCILGCWMPQNDVSECTVQWISIWLILQNAFSLRICNEGCPFYLGYVLTAKYKTKVSTGYLFNICFQPSWKSLDSNAYICYVGQKDKTYYPIVLKQDSIPKH